MLSAAQTDWVVQDALKIAQTPSPTGGEAARGELIQRLLAEDGIQSQVDTVGNIISHFGDTDSEALIVCAHLDTVFAADTPLHPVCTGTTIALPGIGDNSLGVAGLLWLARQFQTEPPTNAITLAWSVGEEGLGNLRGARHLCQALKPSTFVAVEGSGVGRIATTAIGSLRYKITVQADGGHSWNERLQPNAVHELVLILTHILHDAKTTSCNIGHIDGGEGINCRAAHANATVEFRDQNPACLASVKELMAHIQCPATVSIQIELIGDRPAGSIDHQHPLAQTAQACWTSDGLPQPIFMEGSYDSNAAHGIGIPAIAVGLAHGTRIHTLDERVDWSPISYSLPSLQELCRTYSHTKSTQ